MEMQRSAAAVATSDEHRLQNERTLQLPRHATHLSLPLLNARAQIVVRNQREACTRSETNKTAALTERLTRELRACLGAGGLARCKPRLYAGALVAAVAGVTQL